MTQKNIFSGLAAQANLKPVHCLAPACACDALGTNLAQLNRKDHEFHTSSWLFRISV